MTKRQFSTVVDHSTDAGYQTWLNEIHTELQTAGLVQTADTGQLTMPFAGVRPGVGAYSGKLVYKLNDSLFGSAPIYLLLEPGTAAGGTSQPQMRWSFASGTNGASVLNGVVSSAVNINTTSSPTSTVTTYVTNICVVDGFFGLAWKLGSGGSNNGCRGFFSVQRTVNAAGAPDSTGAMGIWGSSVTSLFGVQCLGFSTAVAYTFINTAASFPCVISGRKTSSLLPNGNYEVYSHQISAPDTRFAFGTCTAIASEFAFGNTIPNYAIIASAQHTYISLGAVGVTETTAVPATYSMCMLWE